MSEPVCLLVLGKGYTEAWYQLSEAEQQALWEKLEEIEDRAGGAWTISCDSRWADEEIHFWGVLKYPTIEAYRQKVKELEEVSWWRYFRVKSILGTEMEG